MALGYGCFEVFECFEFKRGRCCIAWLSVLWCSSVLKEYINIRSDEKNYLEKLGKPQLMQIHETLLPTNPA